MNKLWVFLISTIAAITLTACGDDQNGAEDNVNKEVEQSTHQTEDSSGNGPGSLEHSEMNHSSSGELPAGLKKAENPTYPVGTKAIITANHMEGMEGAEATIVGAFDTTAYVVSYTPITGGKRVTNHKWVIHEEIDQAPDFPIEPNSEVSLNADHMPGMKGAVAVIEDLEETTVYMVDYISTTGEKVKNHKWLTEEELKLAD
ncbi:YdhK family protein [Chungangia koreensis]|uniref:YdhK family protein n=1 Tax=Chungangia koreensis TaxID=752657 RepID=A0ABV8X6H2_9LACT